MTVEDTRIRAKRTQGVGRMPDGTIVGPGDEALVERGEAHESEFWEPVNDPTPKALIQREKEIKAQQEADAAALAATSDAEGDA